MPPPPGAPAPRAPRVAVHRARSDGPDGSPALFAPRGEQRHVVDAHASAVQPGGDGGRAEPGPDRVVSAPLVRAGGAAEVRVGGGGGGYHREGSGPGHGGGPDSSAGKICLCPASCPTNATCMLEPDPCRGVADPPLAEAGP